LGDRKLIIRHSENPYWTLKNYDWGVMKISKTVGNSYRIRSTWLVAFLALTSIAIAPTHANAEVVTPVDGTVMFYSLNSGDSYSGAAILDRPNATDTLRQTRLNPIVIGLCNGGASGLTVVDMNSAFDGVVSLKCGTNSDGYVHIRSRHQASWEAQKGSGGLWDDYMVWATGSALSAPSAIYSLADAKRCYTAPIAVFKYVNGSPQYVKTFNPTIIVSSSGRKVITSIPTNTSSC
jgi:hypothetical protein